MQIKLCFYQFYSILFKFNSKPIDSDLKTYVEKEKLITVALKFPTIRRI